MYSIVLIDDEPWTLQDLSNIINWADYGFSDVVLFSNPVEGAEYIKKHKPNAVCTDIRMPELSGLDLLFECRESCPNTLFNVISAYAEFELAQRAVHEGAFSYLLKPLMDDDLCELAEKMRKTILARQNDLLKRTVRSITVGILLSSPINAEDDAVISESKLFAYAYQIAVSGCSLAKQIGGNWFRIYDDLFVGILSDAFTLPDNVICGIGIGAKTPQEVRSSIKYALMSFFTLRFYGIKAGSLEYHSEDVEYLFRDCKLLISFAMEENKLLVGEKLKEIERNAVNSLVSIQSLTIFYNKILSVLLQENTQRELQENFSRFVNEFQMYCIFNNHKEYFHSIHLLLNNIKTTLVEFAGDEDIADSIVNYLDTHFAEPITLEFFSDKFNLSLSQVSRYIKKKSGCSFIAYLTQKRINRACMLLAQTKYPITSISEMVGYSDYFYFAKKFKSFMMETPSQYRRRMIDETE